MKFDNFYGGHVEMENLGEKINKEDFIERLKE